MQANLPEKQDKPDPRELHAITAKLLQVHKLVQVSPLTIAVHSVDLLIRDIDNNETLY